MKKILKYTMLSAVLPILTGGFCSCKKDDTVTDPAKAILGKWEFVGVQLYKSKTEPRESSGYLEFLPDSLVAWYDYTIKEYVLLEWRYWLETAVSENGWHTLRFRNPAGGTTIERPLWMDWWGHFLHELKFLSKNKLEVYDDSYDGGPDPRPTLIYQRKK
jgi:hypothetical protein